MSGAIKYPIWNSKLLIILKNYELLGYVLLNIMSGQKLVKYIQLIQSLTPKKKKIKATYTKVSEDQSRNTYDSNHM